MYERYLYQGIYEHIIKINYKEDINNKDYVFKVSDEIVYERGLIKVQMSEMVKFLMECRGIYVIYNHISNADIVSSKIFSEATGLKLRTKEERVYIQIQPKVRGGCDVQVIEGNQIGIIRDIKNRNKKRSLETNIEDK
jgi:F0F1-type ATP synthase alpha subunit